ncbi:Uncharacterised protein [Klebsiella pneumoniae]|nr:Uncharacterised protein [Klebsiella pneumoniae]
MSLYLHLKQFSSLWNNAVAIYGRIHRDCAKSFSGALNMLFCLVNWPQEVVGAIVWPVIR